MTAISARPLNQRPRITRLIAVLAMFCVTLLPGARAAMASGLERNTGAGHIRSGLDFAVDGVGLSVSGQGTLTVPAITGTIEEAYLYWAGAWQDSGEPHDTVLVDGTPFLGTSIGTEVLPTRTAFAFKADVSSLFAGDTPPDGTVSVTVEDPLHGDELSGLDGATLLVIFRDATDEGFHEVQVFEGCDYAWADNLPAPSGYIEPVTFNYGASANARQTRLVIVCADSSIARPDRIEVTGNATLLNTLDGSDGPQWDTDIYGMTIPPGGVSTTVELVSPPEFGQLADSMQWVLAVMRVSCEGSIGGRMWSDVNENGLQDPEEATENIPGVPLTLLRFNEGGDLVEIDSTTSDGDGRYVFNGLCAGQYLVEHGSGLLETIPNVGANDDIDSDFSNGFAFVELLSDSDAVDNIDGGFQSGPIKTPGACCLASGACIDVTDISACEIVEGIFQGGLTQCSDPDINCPQPIAACCLPSGQCKDLELPACDALGGTWRVGSLCIDDPCAPVTAACCLPDGSCVVNEKGDCGLLGGIWQEPGTSCADVDCPDPTGACCLPDGTCIETTEAECNAQAATYQGDLVECANVACPDPTGACCLEDGSCTEVMAILCDIQGGTYQGDFTACGDVSCPQPTGACCLVDGSCVEAEETACTDQGGTYQGDFTACGDVSCPQPTGACCLVDGSCVEVEETACTDQGGTYQGDFTACGDVSCPQPTGACCLIDGSCVEVEETACTDQGGTYQGDFTACGDVSCPQPDGPTNRRASTTIKGSLLILPMVEIRWDTAGNVIQDVVVSMTNDYPDDVRVLMYFVNGDEPTTNDPGWNFVDNEFTLTANQPVAWSVATGDPYSLSPFSILDPGTPPGRLDPELSGDYVLRGFIVAWAVGIDGQPIAWNHLSARATTVDYLRDTGHEYAAVAFPAVDENFSTGENVTNDGTLPIDGEHYVWSPSMLAFNFHADGDSVFSQPGNPVSSESDLTLMPISIDFNDGGVPVTTTAHFTIWNEAEVKLSGLRHCITCWDQTLLQNYASPNHFMPGALQSRVGKARIDGVTSILCPDSVDAAILGVAVRSLRFEMSGDADDVASELQGMGLEQAVIKYLPVGPPPISPAGQ